MKATLPPLSWDQSGARRRVPRVLVVMVTDAAGTLPLLGAVSNSGDERDRPAEEGSEGGVIPVWFAILPRRASKLLRARKRKGLCPGPRFQRQDFRAIGQRHECISIEPKQQQ